MTIGSLSEIEGNKAVKTKLVGIILDNIKHNKNKHAAYKKYDDISEYDINRIAEEMMKIDWSKIKEETFVAILLEKIEDVFRTERKLN